MKLIKTACLTLSLTAFLSVTSHAQQDGRDITYSPTQLSRKDKIIKPKKVAKLPSKPMSSYKLGTPLAAPLHYLKDGGLYAANLHIGKDNQVLQAIVDTGSSNLVLIGGPKICDQCSNIVSGSMYTPGPDAKALPNYFSMSYGSATGLVREYQDLVGASDDPKIPTTYAVFIANRHAGNILGMAYQNIAAPHAYPLQTYFDAMVERFKLKNIFSLQLCSNRGPSKIIFGGQPKNIDPSKILYTPVVSKAFYTVLLNGITDKATGKFITQFGPNPMNKTAIIDSGTSGQFMLPANAYLKIMQYIKQKVVANNLILPKKFWLKGQCLSLNKRQIKAFPTLQVALAKLNAPGKSIYLDLPPERYLVHNYCRDHRQVEIAFKPSGQGRSVRNFHNINVPGQATVTSKIIGTPLLENYISIFHRGELYNTSSTHNARIGFYPSDKFCK